MKDKKGFTIIELLIATSVFAVVLLIAQSSFLGIGHLFYKGVAISNTQDVADHILQDINGSFPGAAGVTTGSSNGYNYYCIGNTRYTYRLNNEIDTSQDTTYASDGNFGILKDLLPGSGSQCATPCYVTCPTGSIQLNNPSEILGNKMRAVQFDISQSTTTSNLYNISVVLAYGDDNTFVPNTLNQPATMACQSDKNNNFCAVSRIYTSVFRGGH